MRFSKKRGRPAVEKIQKDHGTKELQQKRQRLLTAEPLDICLKKGIVSADEHDAGMRLRWLYTLRFGAPGITAYHPEGKGPSCFRQDNDQWLDSRRSEYDSAIVALKSISAARVVMNVCIFNMHAPFMFPAGRFASMDARRIATQTRQFKDGLELLAELFGKRSVTTGT